MTTVTQRLELRAYYAKNGWMLRCSKCRQEINHSFDIVDGEPVHYSCAGEVLVKGPERWKKGRC